MSRKSCLIDQLVSAMETELVHVPGSMSLSEIQQRMEEINSETREIIANAARIGSSDEYTIRLQELVEETAMLKEKRVEIERQRNGNTAATDKLSNAAEALNYASAELREWNESVIRQLVEAVKVLSADKIIVYLRGGIEVEQEIH